MDDLDSYRTESQQEWKRWADSGYPKRYQPRSIRRTLAIFCTLFAVGIVAILWLSATGRLP